MDRNKSALSPSKRQKTGATILAAVRVINTKPVQKRLDAFARTHRTYCDAQAKVEKVEAELHAAQAQVAQLDTEQDAAVEALALSLANNGHSRAKPFAAFGVESPGRMQALPFAEEAQAIQALVASLRRDPSLSPAILDAAQRAEKAAKKVQAALAPLHTLRNTLTAARERRDQLGPAWDASLAVLRRGALAAGDSGAPGLYTSLFGRRTRVKKPKVAPAQATPSPAPPAPATAPAPPAAPTA